MQTVKTLTLLSICVASIALADGFKTTHEKAARHPPPPPHQPPKPPGEHEPGKPPHQPPEPPYNAPIQPYAPPLTKEQQEEKNFQDQGFRSFEQYRKWKEKGRLDTERRHFDLQNTPGPGIQHVKFQPGNHIPECEKWRDSRYNGFRNYTATWHDADWWKSHHPRIVFVCGGWYYWHANYWFPASGYHPDAVYAYDGPIYAYNDLAPDQAIANVQATLHELGYYHGPINGYLDSATRAAIANYQSGHGLYTTSAIDEPTLASLGMA
jgi:hypothetical protein